MSKKASNRDEFSQKVIDVIAKRAFYICSNPDCRAVTIAPSNSDPNKIQYIGIESHITAAAPKGPRYDPSITPRERKSIGNAIFLCSSCAAMIDKNSGIDYPADLIRKWKNEHENCIKDNFNKSITRLIQKNVTEKQGSKIETKIKGKFRKLYKILFKTEPTNINRAELITLIDNEIGQDKIAKILKLRYKKEYSESSGEVLSLYNENWRLNCQTGLEPGYGLNALNIYNSNNKIYHYGSENQDETILESFKKYFFEECSKADIMVDEIYWANQMTKIFEDYERKNKTRRRTVF